MHNLEEEGVMDRHWTLGYLIYIYMCVYIYIYIFIWGCLKNDMNVYTHTHTIFKTIWDKN